MSALYLQGKSEVFSLVHNNNEFDSHSTLVDADSTQQQIQSFLLKLYGASSCASQKEFCYMPTTRQSAECYYPYPSSWQLCLQVLQPNNIPEEHISLFGNGWWGPCTQQHGDRKLRASWYQMTLAVPLVQTLCSTWSPVAAKLMAVECHVASEIWECTVLPCEQMHNFLHVYFC